MMKKNTEVPDRKSICPDRPRRKVPMFRLSRVQNFHCVLRALSRICPDHPRPKAYIVQTFVRSCPDHRALQIKFVRSKTKVLVRPSPDHRAFIRVSRPCNFERTTTPSCVHFGLDISTFILEPQPGALMNSRSHQFLKRITTFKKNYCS